MFFWYHVLPLSLLLSSVIKVLNGAEHIVETENGRVRGREALTVGLKVTYYAYQGIPYAKAPVGDLRFEPPAPTRNWSGIIDATRDGKVCVQNNDRIIIGSEDCLNLNVYVPQIENGNGVLLPTMVWIYGGGFAYGQASYNPYGPDFLLDKGVAVVTVNYRLGIFGFLSTGDIVAPGNAGLKDQVLALRWVKNNIKYFGGDPNQVTLFGESAGSASVSYHLQSKQSTGLFQRAIMESGVSLSPWALSRRIPIVVRIIAAALLLDLSSSRTIVNALKKVDYTILQLQSSNVIDLQYLLEDPRSGLVYGPVIEPEHETAFFTNKSYELLSRGDFARVPVIVGFNSLEIGLTYNAAFRLYISRYDIDQTKLIPVDLNVAETRRISAASRIKKYYFGNDLIAFSDKSLNQFLSDDQFVRPTREFVRQVSKYAPVYFYRFSFEGRLSGVENRSQPGVTHAEELYYIWRYNTTGSEADYLTRDRVTSLWTNFAKTGNPTPASGSAQLGVTWRQADQNFTFLDIGTDLKLEQFPEVKNMKFWDKLYIDYGRRPYDTY